MNLFEAIIFGIVQGLTEFLPVSSSGHLRIVEELFDVNVESNLTLIVVLHFATVLSIFIVFRKDIHDLINGVLKKEKKSINYFLLLLLSVIPVLVFRLIVGAEFIDKLYNNITLVSIGLLFTSAALFTTYFFKPKDNHKKLTWMNVLVMGIFQAISIIPGISRSGSTATAGIVSGVERKEAAKFVFLMAILPIVGGTFLDLIEIIRDGSLSENITIELCVAFVTALITGIFAAKLTVSLLVKNNLLGFAIYTLVLGVLTLIFL